MQIHYIWIKEYNNLKKAGINLSSNLLIDMDDDFTLTIETNPNYIDDFIEEKNITNVSAIIGKNGTGKSSVLRYIKGNLPKGVSAIVKNDLFIYSVYDDHKRQSYFIAYPETMPLKIVNNAGLNFTEETYNNLRSSSRLDDFTYIYYHYLPEFNEDNKNWDGLQNISTTSLLQKERKRILEDFRSLKENQTLLSHTNDLDFLHLQEVLQAIVLLTHTNEKLPFRRPKNLSMNIDRSERQVFQTDQKTYKDVVILLQKLEKRIPLHSDIKDLFLSNLLEAIFINFLITERKYSVNNPYLHKIPLRKNENRDEYIRRFFSTMEDASTMYKDKKIEISRLKELSWKVPQFTALVSKMIDNKKIYVTDETETHLLIDFEAEDDFRTFQQAYATIRGMTSFLQFRWRSLSAGEQSYLSFVSRFYSLIHDKSVTLQKNLMILIDEGDAGFHPEWQRKFFKNAMDFLSSIFADKNIQLIFTSNTPFLTSDLLKCQILFVDKTENGKSTFLSKRNHNENTFAANIHTLFSDSFYMDGMLIGEYAKDKINKIISYLNNKKVSKPNDNYKKIIDSIGEPILRKKLTDMWFEKFGLEEELAILEERMKEVKLKIKNKKK
ncbi:AAA domain-containing protein, putative AbiEii toxin, Type IV TA system [Chryseobacterium vrystaatense]|uniref:AAA domain-containing protein, putative AbiEii toxin, Type IV TA system n=1 Tax=Chryseobacterium vrystaatense TaxID=307480 RepID=A0A1M5GUS0_9FLAO|nr:AAA domain-containing protein, putative AbiEii toxin, Type IV TA system [Chryseobacterium vrystaatense]